MTCAELAVAMTCAELVVASRYAAAVPRVVLTAERSAVTMALFVAALIGRPAASAQSRAALPHPEHRPALPESEAARRCHPRR
jgi:adenine/guanine phosphoribosyltransferase-like PRPP-binding protein